MAAIPRKPWQEQVRTEPPEEVTRAGDEARTRLPVDGIWADMVALYKTGLHPAIGLCVRHHGEVVLDRTIGHVHNPPGGVAGDIATPDTPFNLFSASKILTGLVVMSLVEDGRLTLDRRAAHWLPELATHGKERITLRHLLHHTAGIPNMPPGVNPEASLKTGVIPVEPLYGMRLSTEPGTRAAYHALTSWLLLAEIVHRETGQDLRTIARDRLLAPLGLTRPNYGVDLADVGRVAKHARTGPPVPRLMARIFHQTLGIDVPTVVALTNEPGFLTAILPSANAIGTGRQVTELLQVMLDGGRKGGVRVLETSTIGQMTTDLTPLQFDGTFGLPMRYGLGVMMGERRVSLYGPNMERAFGHLGFSNVIVYADPARDVAVSFVNTGKPMLALGSVRWWWALQRLAQRIPR